jgi:ubiquinone/menaquinone biosynthesis C-methylase UbiE
VTGAPAPRQDHYSYRVYADAGMAEAFDGLRFSGPIGQLIANTQEEVIAGFLNPIAGRTVLDVGTGTGRAAIALARRGARVTGVDASAEMLVVADRRARDAGVEVAFLSGDAHGLGFGDRSFDAVVCLRVLMHTPDWQRSLAELCRVARDRVVFDYPSLWSAAALQASARRVAHGFGARVEAYRVFRRASIAAALTREGFQLAGEHHQFVLPIALHKRLNSEAATRRVERMFSRIGLTRLFGSPVTVVAVRCGS